MKTITLRCSLRLSIVLPNDPSKSQLCPANQLNPPATIQPPITMNTPKQPRRQIVANSCIAILLLFTAFAKSKGWSDVINFVDLAITSLKLLLLLPDLSKTPQDKR